MHNLGDDPPRDERPTSRALPTTADRYRTVVTLLQEILTRLGTIERDIDDMDRTLRPHGDGTKITRRGRRD